MARAAICGSARTASPARNGRTISAARLRCSACSCPVGACTSPTWTKRRATSFARSATSVLDHAEQLLDRPFEGLRDLQSRQRRGDEHPVLDGVDGLPANADAGRQFGLRPAAKLALGAKTIGEPLTQAGEPSARARQS